MKIILDTNFLLIPAQFKVDIFSEIDRICLFPYELYIVDKTISELEKIIKEQKGKDKAAAKLALDMLKAKNIDILESETEKSVDDIIKSVVNKKEFVVATQDIPLKRALKSKNIPIITMRQKKKLIIEGKI